MTFNIAFSMTNSQRRLQNISNFLVKMTSPEMPLIASRRVAAVWLKNFSEEGSMVGGWDGLADTTIEDRHGQEHPILQRDMALLKASVLNFMSPRAPKAGKYAWTESSHSYGRARPTTASLELKNGRAKLSVKGAKVWNQIATTGPSAHPARPFWFVDDTVQAHATKAVSDFVTREASKV